jgi:hypothetical protein
MVYPLYGAVVATIKENPERFPDTSSKHHNAFDPSIVSRFRCSVVLIDSPWMFSAFWLFKNGSSIQEVWRI